MKKLVLISIGPGDATYRLPISDARLIQVTDLVAYQLYLDLIPQQLPGKVCHSSELGSEIERARLALDLAAEGRITALISSGDIGIYAMAAVVFELLNNENKQSWRDIEIEVVPGVTAMQTLAARVGAPLGHDFCAISLSDLLTSWTVIEKRILAAAQGDFVVSFYNPVSRKRNWQLDRAKEVLLDYRAPSTPVILGRNLTRDNESIVVTHLEKLRSSDVDMLTIVMVGSSTSVAFQHNQKLCVYTPRGYEKKYDIKCKDEHPADVSAKFTTPLSI